MASIGDVMRHCRNYFERWSYSGEITIGPDGELTGMADVTPHAYAAIRGSACHDGVWRVSGGRLEGMEPGLPEETFNGTVWALAPPPGFVGLCEQIDAFDTQRPAGPLASESFGAYSYSVQTGQSGAITWQESYAAQLLPYRRMLTEVGV